MSAKKKNAKLIPPDLERCQAEERSFMTLGPGMNRCADRSVWVAREVKQGKDGLLGEMSLCSKHREAFERVSPGRATFELCSKHRAKSEADARG